MYKIGITGGIGAGKSTVSHIFMVLGIPVYDADQHARKLMETDTDLMNSIKKLLGEDAYHGQDLNRSWIAKQVFSDRWLLHRLNGIVHPAVERTYLQWHQQQEDVMYTLKEAALIFDAGSYLTLDATILVTASESLRIARVAQRDGSTETEIRKRMEQQWPEDRRLQMADFVIHNEGDLPLIPQVLKIHQELIEN